MMEEALRDIGVILVGLGLSGCSLAAYYAVEHLMRIRKH